MRRAWLKAGGRAAAAAVVVGLLGVGSALAERIKLTDGAELSAEVVDRSPESLIVRVPRTAVATVDGQPLPPPLLEGAPAPAFHATDLAGVARSLTDSAGQVTLLQFWASWCPYCRKDLPLMKQLFAQHEGKGVRIVTVSIDEDLEKLKAFVGNEAVPYPIIAAAGQPGLPELYETRGIPAYFLIDQRGRIAGVWRGSVTQVADPGQKTELEQRLAQLLNPSGIAEGR
jgi:peroxiredoxin